MNSKRSLLIVFILAFSSLAAQDTLYDLNDFFVPNLKRHSLENRFSLSSGLNNNILDDGYYADLFINADAFLSSSYLYTHNSRKWQRRLQASLSVNEVFHGEFFGGNHSASATNKINNNFDAGLYLMAETRYYYKDKKFVEVIPILESMLAFNHRLDEDPASSSNLNIKNTENQTLIQPQLYLGVGYGRIERIEDARHAVYILETLKKNDRLARDYRPEDVNRLATRIAEIKNERLLDSRQKSIYEMEQLDAFLKMEGLAGECDAAYFTGLYDIWMYGGNVMRLSGQRFGIGIKPGFSNRRQTARNYLSDVLQNENIIHEDELVLESSLYFQYHQALSMKHQISLWSGMGLAKRDFKSVSNQILTNRMDRTAVYLTANGFFGIYPDTRNLIELGCVLNVEYSNNDYSNTTQSQDSQVLSTAIGPMVKAVHYFSPALQIELRMQTVRMFRYVNSSLNSTGINLNSNELLIMAQLNYQLF